MNIVVAMKQIPDLQQIRIRNREPVLNDVPLTLGNIEKNALEAGVLLRDELGGKVTILSAGNENIEDTLKEGLAAGADEAFLVIGDSLENAESNVVAAVLAAALKKMEDRPGLILFGEGSGDNYSGQVGSRVAEILELPQVSFATSIEVKDDKALVTRSLENGEEMVEVNLPAVIAVLADINEPRIPSVTQILKAGKKPKEVLELEDIGVEEAGESMITTVSNLAPATERKRIVVKSVDELLQALTAEGYVGR